jgi:hypothetical protein
MRQLLLSVGIVVAMYFIWVFCQAELNAFNWSKEDRLFLSVVTIIVVFIYNAMEIDSRL